MPTPADFEEREYENHLYQEIARKPGHFWTPGQVLEGLLGFDAALRASLSFWKHVGAKRRRGIVLTGSSLGLPTTHAAARKGSLPDFSANVFVQAKRCNVYARYPSALRRYDKELKGKRCYGFDVYDTIRPGAGRARGQQNLLEILSHRLGPRAYVCYAAPAFASRKELFSAVTAGTLLARSSLPRASWLKGHSRWAYIGPGSAGYCCSEPVVHTEDGWDAYVRSIDPPTVNHGANLRVLSGLVRDALLDVVKAQDPVDDSGEQVRVRWLGEVFDETTESDAELVGRTAAALAAFGVLWFGASATES